LLPPNGHTEDQTLPTPYQGLGARAVNNLASKLSTSLFPPSNAFFRLGIDTAVMQQMSEEGLQSKVEQKLAQIEEDMMSEFEAKALRVKLFEAIKHLIVVGDVLPKFNKDNSIQLYKLDSYVIRRNSAGKTLEIITKESVDLDSLPEELEELIRADIANEDPKKDKEYDLFTHIQLDETGKKWNVKQECEGHIIDGTEGSYKYDDLPWKPLRWSAVSGESYGRSHVEEYLGDFVTLESLTKALVEGTVVAGRIIGLVNPAGSTRASKLVKAKNGDFVEGRADDVSYLQLDKYMDFNMCYQTINKIEQRIKSAFIVVEGVQRDAERVTAEEIRLMANELENSLGGVYSLLSLEMQLPIVKQLLSQMSRNGQLPSLPKDIVSPTIVTGIEALGRGHDLDKLLYFMDAIAPLGQEEISRYLITPDFMRRSATALSINTNGLIKTQEQVQEEMNQAQMNEMAQNMAPQVAGEAMKGEVADG